MKNKRLLAIVVTVLGGFTALIALLAVIASLAGGVYEDVHVFDLDLKAAAKPLQTSGFTRIDKVALSLWLNVPDRTIENKTIDLDVFLIGIGGTVEAKFHEEFALDTVRYSSRKGQHYRLGEHVFAKGFTGAFRYQISGNWVPPFKGRLVLRKSLSDSAPIQSIGFLIMGFVLFLVGIGMIRNSGKHI